MRSAGSPGSPDPESSCKPRAGSLTLASPLPRLADGHSPSTADGLVPLLVEMVQQKDIFSAAADMLPRRAADLPLPPVHMALSTCYGGYSRMDLFIFITFCAGFPTAVWFEC